MRHEKTYDPFCPYISTRPSASYEEIVKKALISYPGAKGDEKLALSFMAQHQEWSIKRAIEHYSEYHKAEDEREYQNDWVSRCMDYWSKE